MILDIQKIDNHYFINVGKNVLKETYIKHSFEDMVSLIRYKIENLVGVLDKPHEVSSDLEFKPERDFGRENMSEIDKDKANLAMKKMRLDHLDKNLKTGADDMLEALKGETNESKEKS